LGGATTTVAQYKFVSVLRLNIAATIRFTRVGSIAWRSVCLLHFKRQSAGARLQGDRSDDTHLTVTTRSACDDNVRAEIVRGRRAAWSDPRSRPGCQPMPVIVHISIETIPVGFNPIRQE
jgi:hypothetical protein